MKPVIINNRWKWILGGTIVVLGSICLLIDMLFFDSEIAEYGFRAPLIIVPVLTPFLVCYEIKDMPVVKITDNNIYARYPNRLQRGYVDLNKPVYYAVYCIVADGEYILISNKPIELNQRTVLTQIDYSEQLSLRYSKKIKRIFPKEDWIKVVLRDGDYTV